ncbi:IS200/IS605 family transposase [Roseofilum sp. BLCC_M91]|uniref:IS200/IS605 family transposase n=1 Tax=Roseofilum halophilum BLCC-M91 TaxID=3022259 RepID=A0ABT7BDW1_9CYAN|nr:IS200/IS605 family transposase [Roseofilum halophilum]MDJ1177362.1 IS200/IS605 family transposase [Roseofilum halophilum BLCC-M91]
MQTDFISRGRSVSDLKAHLVLTTKYKRNVFTGEMLHRLHEILEVLLVKWECKLIEFNGEENHIHLLFQYHPNVLLSKLVNNIKTVTSRKLRQEFVEPVNKLYWKDALWNGSYFVASCGGVTISTLKKYIENKNSPQ